MKFQATPCSFGWQKHAVHLQSHLHSKANTEKYKVSGYPCYFGRQKHTVHPSCKAGKEVQKGHDRYRLTLGQKYVIQFRAAGMWVLLMFTMDLSTGIINNQTLMKRKGRKEQSKYARMHVHTHTSAYTFTWLQ
jgi:hypothetical protein